MTQQEKVIEYLTKKGCRPLQSNSGKYLKYSYPGQFDKFYWVGKNGAVRVGKTVKDSFSIGDLIKRNIQHQERKNKNVSKS